MERTEYEKMAEFEEYYWWHVGRMHIIRKQLDRFATRPDLKILNIGSGAGGTISLLERYGTVTNVDVSAEAIAFARAKGFNNLVQCDGNNLPFPKDHFDLAVAFDVLEHIQEDEAGLQEWKRVLKPNGSLFMAVPAYQWLWSEHDESLHHYRRYTASHLYRMLNLAGFRVSKITYAITAAFPLIVLYRFLRSLKAKVPSQAHSSYVVLPKVVNQLLVLLLWCEAQLLYFANLPFGTSVLTVCYKKPEADTL
jgi:ubiquinone/menaquinone biosynthesis C-methylase UbiE